MKVLVTGITGLLGRALSAELSTTSFDVVGTGFRRATGNVVAIDLTDREAVERLLREQRPDVIIHSAAERRPDVSENDPDATLALNVEATRSVVEIATEIGAQVVYLSTDYVFDGSSPPYRPDATPNPLNFYAKSKLEGEHVVRTVADNCVLRVPVLYGQIETLEESPVTIIAKGLLPGGEIKLDHWQTRDPTSTADVAAVLRQMLESRVESASIAGTVHWSGDEAMTKYDMGRTMCQIWGLPHDNLIPQPDPPGGAPRPKDTQLDCGKLEALGIGQRTRFRDALAAAIAPFAPAGG
jgi:S-adenosylmethionine synthetase